MRASRASVASSFTLIKGAMIPETYAVFAAWDFERSKGENLSRLREKNFIGASSDTWLRDVAKVINRRFEPHGRDRALILLAKRGCDLEVWRPLLLWHITRDEFLNKLWGEDVYVTHRVIDTHMAALRKKLEDDPNSQKHILSVPGVGYRLG